VLLWRPGPGVGRRQTGSGKTHTMQGNPDDRGVNFRALHELFRLKDEGEGMTECSMALSVLEVRPCPTTRSPSTPPSHPPSHSPSHSDRARASYRGAQGRLNTLRAVCQQFAPCVRLRWGCYGHPVGMAQPRAWVRDARRFLSWPFCLPSARGGPSAPNCVSLLWTLLLQVHVLPTHTRGWGPACFCVRGCPRLGACAQIYNESVRDLLTDGGAGSAGGPGLEIGQNKRGDTVVRGLTSLAVTSMADVVRGMDLASRQRSVGAFWAGGCAFCVCTCMCMCMCMCVLVCVCASVCFARHMCACARAGHGWLRGFVLRANTLRASVPWVSGLCVPMPTPSPPPPPPPAPNPRVPPRLCAAVRL
jgi:hypothetical protein